MSKQQRVDADERACPACPAFPWWPCRCVTCSHPCVCQMLTYENVETIKAVIVTCCSYFHNTSHVTEEALRRCPSETAPRAAAEVRGQPVPGLC